MSYAGQVDADYVHFLESMVNLDALDRITEDLGEELKDSQQVMNQIRGMIDSMPKNAQDIKPELNSGFRHEGISNLLNDSTPKLLMPDMVETTYDLDLDDVIRSMKCYTEYIMKNLNIAEPTQVANVKKELEDLDLEQYATSLDVLCKRLNNMKLNKKPDGYQRNPDLEAKLAVLSDDVKTFTQMVHAKTSLSKANMNWTPTQQQTHALSYDQIVSKLLSGINEVTYLLHRKN